MVHLERNSVRLWQRHLWDVDMRIDSNALNRAWKQTAVGTLLGALIIAGLLIYFFTKKPLDYQAIEWLIVLLALMPVALGVAYLIRRFIQRLAG